ncbi:hypothetical protein [Bradyrhizobium tunisiense]|uniref:hypothetical protein n=1 Tax=Bradyrhizobium tunisiense TaxID=3278709 RepID=UPI0035DB468E
MAIWAAIKEPLADLKFPGLTAITIAISRRSSAPQGRIVQIDTKPFQSGKWR